MTSRPQTWHEEHLGACPHGAFAAPYCGQCVSEAQRKSRDEERAQATAKEIAEKDEIIERQDATLDDMAAQLRTKQQLIERLTESRSRRSLRLPWRKKQDA